MVIAIFKILYIYFAVNTGKRARNYERCNHERLSLIRGDTIIVEWIWPEGSYVNHGKEGARLSRIIVIENKIFKQDDCLSSI